MGRPAKVMRVRLADDPVLASVQTRGSIGKTCPYCQVPVKPGAPTKICPACEIPHREECWLENGGCTTFGCAGTPGPARLHDHAAVATHRPAPALNSVDLTSALCALTAVVMSPQVGVTEAVGADRAGWNWSSTR